jgi:hypothetical protein
MHGGQSLQWRRYSLLFWTVDAACICCPACPTCHVGSHTPCKVAAAPACATCAQSERGRLGATDSSLAVLRSFHRTGMACVRPCSMVLTVLPCLRLSHIMASLTHHTHLSTSSRVVLMFAHSQSQAQFSQSHIISHYHTLWHHSVTPVDLLQGGPHVSLSQPAVVALVKHWSAGECGTTATGVERAHNNHR